MKTQILILLTLLLCVVSCKNGDNEENHGVFLDGGLHLRYIDSNKVDLLDTNSAVHYDEDSIKIYYLMCDSTVVLCSPSERKDPGNIGQKGFEINFNGTEYVLEVDLFATGINGTQYDHTKNLTDPNYRTVYIQLNAHETDTVCATLLNNHPGMTTYDQVYYNGKLIIPAYPLLCGEVDNYDFCCPIIIK